MRLKLSVIAGATYSTFSTITSAIFWAFSFTYYLIFFTFFFALPLISSSTLVLLAWVEISFVAFFAADSRSDFFYLTFSAILEVTFYTWLGFCSFTFFAFSSTLLSVFFSSFLLSFSASFFNTSWTILGSYTTTSLAFFPAFFTFWETSYAFSFTFSFTFSYTFYFTLSSTLVEVFLPFSLAFYTILSRVSASYYFFYPLSTTFYSFVANFRLDLDLLASALHYFPHYYLFFYNFSGCFGFKSMVHLLPDFRSSHFIFCSYFSSVFFTFELAFDS